MQTFKTKFIFHYGRNNFKKKFYVLLSIPWTYLFVVYVAHS